MQSPASLSGMIAVNKPVGLVSKDVSRLLVRRFGKIKIGHVGTLDPLADGVLPILIGRATRLQDHLLALPKTYIFTVKYGEETDTLDLEGKVVKISPVKSVSEEVIREVLPQFIGDISQIPPLYSAIKVRGKPLYQYARSERASEVSLEDIARKVTIYDLQLLTHTGDTTQFSVRCSKGTYVRSLARDIAALVGTVGTIVQLTRTECAGIKISDAFSMEALQSLEMHEMLLSAARLNVGLPCWRSQRGQDTQKLRQGQKLLVCWDLFAKSIGELEGEIDSNLWKPGPLFMLDEAGEALGVGEMRPLDRRMVQLHLRRGL